MSRVVQISCLGSFGRFGNQLFQYAFARAYAEAHGAVLETPPWIGQKLFNLNDRPIRNAKRKLPLEYVPNGEVNIDLWGYFQGQNALDYLRCSKIKEWFTFQDRWLQMFPKQSSYAAAHVRRGDYAAHAGVFRLVSEQSYINACHKFGIDVEKLVWVREQDAKPNELDAEGLGFLPDFFKLRNADSVLRANSTFSFWAGLLGESTVYSPVVDDKLGEHTVEFVEGNYPMIVHPNNAGGNGGDFCISD